jgi:hypothetical protein
MMIQMSRNMCENVICGNEIHKLAPTAFHLDSYGMNKKNARPNLRNVSPEHNTQEKKMLYQHVPSEACFPSYGLLTIK